MPAQEKKGAKGKGGGQKRMGKGGKKDKENEPVLLEEVPLADVPPSPTQPLLLLSDPNSLSLACSLSLSIGHGFDETPAVGWKPIRDQMADKEREVIELQARLQQLKGQLHKTEKKLKHEKAKMKTVLVAPELIPKPNGQAGRREGYNLQKAMGLEDQHEFYHEVLRQVRHIGIKYNVDDGVKMLHIPETTLAKVFKE
ncbi:hypothetical protein CALVIDRAFT_568325, partial [Calocera viscosa TUFC12733]